MKVQLKFLFALVAGMVLTGCGSTATTTPEPTAAMPRNTQTLSEATQEPASLPLAEPGPYQVGIRRNLAFLDASRGDREVTVTIWYPALIAPDTPQPGHSPTPALHDIKLAPSNANPAAPPIASSEIGMRRPVPPSRDALL